MRKMGSRKYSWSSYGVQAWVHKTTTVITTRINGLFACGALLVIMMAQRGPQRIIVRM